MEFRIKEGPLFTNTLNYKCFKVCGDKQAMLCHCVINKIHRVWVPFSVAKDLFLPGSQQVSAQLLDSPRPPPFFFWPEWNEPSPCITGTQIEAASTQRFIDKIGVRGRPLKPEMSHDNLQVIISPHICLVFHRSAWCDKDVGGEEMNPTWLKIDLEAESHATLWHILKM